MTKVLVLWVIAAYPTQKCLDANKPKAVVYQVEGSTQVLKGEVKSTQDLKPIYQTLIQDEKPAIKPDPCYDMYIGKVEVKASKQQEEKVDKKK
jgi:hypothetical protein